MRRMQERKTGLLRVATHDGIFIVPVGKYVLQWYTLTATNAEDCCWTATGYFRSFETQYELQEGQELALSIGPPFKAVITASASMTAKMNLNLVVTGADGQRYSLRSGNGSRAKPAFRGVDRTGRVLMEGNFEYG
jgi:hypothetical protein